jgi:S1-C subfamily serine protease
MGTGFFVSPTGHFLTANHVVKDAPSAAKFELIRPRRGYSYDDVIVLGLDLVAQWPKHDFALLKADFDFNKQRSGFEDKKSFPFLEVDFNEAAEGTPVYAFGYPLGHTDYLAGSDPNNPYPLLSAAQQAAAAGTLKGSPKFGIRALAPGMAPDSRPFPPS